MHAQCCAVAQCGIIQRGFGQYAIGMVYMHVYGECSMLDDLCLMLDA